MPELLIISIVALLSFILGHKITIRSINGQSLFSRTSKDNEIEQEYIPPIVDETWEHETSKESKPTNNTGYKEPEMESDYDRGMSS